MAKRSQPTWQPAPEDYERVFAEQNPWHAGGNVPSSLAKRRERPLSSALCHRLVHDDPRRFHLVLGPRRVGKSTCLYQTVRRLLAEGVEPTRLWWLRLDHPLLIEIPLGTLVGMARDMSRASTDRPLFLFLDELTYAADWDLWLKTFYDDRWPVKIAGSSSTTAALRGRRLESGVGRWEEQHLTPYLFTEYLALSHVPVDVPVCPTLAETLHACIEAAPFPGDLAAARRRFMLTGGFPELLLRAVGNDDAEDEATMLLESQRTLRSDAVERAIYKDIPQAFGIGNPMLVERLLYLLAGQVTGILSPQTICRSLDGLSQPTFDKYLSYLERAFLVFTLPNFSGSEETRQRRGRKLYFVDGAVRNAALQRGTSPLTDTQEMGLLIENLVAGHFHALGRQTNAKLYHWREKKDEVDLVYDHPSAPIAVEVGSSAGHSRQALRRFRDRYKRFARSCYLVAPGLRATRPQDTPNGIGTLSLEMMLAAVSAQAERALAGRLWARPA